MKRLRYFDGQFLQVSDFSDEQSYHRRMRQLLNAGLLTGGIVEGLVPAIKNGKLEVSPGLAVDAAGREIVVAEALALDPPAAGGIHLQYHEERADPATAGTVAEETRWIQRPQLTVGPRPSDGVCLGRVTGGSPLNVSTDSREVAKVKMELTGSQSVIVALRNDVDGSKKDIADNTKLIFELAAKIPPPGPEQPKLGRDTSHAWIKSSGIPLALNPEGQNVGIGTTEPKSSLSVSGGLAVGKSYAATNAAGVNHLIVEGRVGIGTPQPKCPLEVMGSNDPLAVLNHVGSSGNPALHMQQDGQFKAAMWWDQKQRSVNIATASTIPALTVQDNGVLEARKGIKANGQPVIVDIGFESHDHAISTGHVGGGWYRVGDIFGGRGGNYGYIRFRVADGTW